MPKQVIIFIAPPGAGKGTQADLIAEKFSFVHVETSKLGEAKIKDEELVKRDPETAEAKRNFESGKLFPSPWTMKLVMERVNKLAAEGRSAVFSGSPRTLYEAKRELPEFEKLYGRDNIKIFYITLSEKESIKRNSNRRICEKNRHPIPNFPEYRNLTTCPQDGSPLITRELDKPEVIKERYKVFKTETEPVLDYFKNNDYEIITIDGEQPIKKVFEDILEHFKK